MNTFNDIFFYYNVIPDSIRGLGQGYPFDFACMCSLPNTFNVLFHLMILAVIGVALIKRPEIAKDRFFLLLFAGIVFSLVSKVLDWYMNYRTAVGSEGVMFFSPTIDIFVALFQLIGIIIILYAIITKLFHVHHERVSVS